MNTPRIRYRIIERHNAQLLVEKVSELVEAGWMPHGSLVYGHCCKHATDPKDQHYYAQPMIWVGKATK